MNKRTVRLCCATVSTPGLRGFHFHKCSKPVRTTVDGRHYCTVHDPANVAARRAASQAQYDRESARRLREYVSVRYLPEAMDLLRLVATECPAPVEAARELLAKIEEALR